jgi:DNA repair exonuclease SbcCD ATPase subunit
MKTISFQRLHAENFKVYTDFTFNFTQFGPGCHSIRGVNKVTPRLGSNGTGKSTLWDALLFALFGKTAKKLRAGDVVPYGTNFNPKVTLDFTVDGAPHRIIRRAWPHALTLHKGDHAVAQSSQEHIEQLLGMDMETFMHTVVLTQGAPLFLDLAPRDKLSLLSSVLNLDRFEGYATTAKGKLSTIKLEDSTLQIARATVEGQLAEVERGIDEMQARAAEFKTANAASIKLFKQRVAEAASSLGTAETAVMAAKVDRDAAHLELLDANAAMSEAAVDHSNGMALRIKAGRMTVGSDCPQCGQPVTKEARARIADEAEKLITGSNHAALMEKHGKLVITYREVDRDYGQLIEVERSASVNLANLKTALDELQVRVNPFTHQLEKLQARQQKLHERATEIDARRAVLETSRQHIEPWVDGFRNIRLVVLDDVLSTLSVLTTSYANELGLPCNVHFGIERTTKAGTTVSGIQMTVDAIEKIEAWSGGEAQRLRLAASLALSASLLVEAGLNIDLLALDEPSAHLSAEGLNELTAFLAQHAEAEGRRIFFTDQRRLNADSTVTLTREGANVSLA